MDVTARRMTCIIRLKFSLVLKSEIVGLGLDSPISKLPKVHLYFLLVGGIHTLHRVEKEILGGKN